MAATITPEGYPYPWPPSEVIQARSRKRFEPLRSMSPEAKRVLSRKHARRQLDERDREFWAEHMRWSIRKLAPMRTRPWWKFWG